MLFTRGILPPILDVVCEYFVKHFTNTVVVFSRNNNKQIQGFFGNKISAIILGNLEKYIVSNGIIF